MTADQTPSRKPHEEAAAWVLKNRDINQSAHEALAFEEWLDHSPENRTAYEAAERLMGGATALKPRQHVAKIILAVAVLGAALVGAAFVLLRG